MFLKSDILKPHIIIFKVAQARARNWREASWQMQLLKGSRGTGIGLREWHRAVSGERQLGITEWFCTRGQWTWNRLARTVGTALRAGVQEAFGQQSQIWMWIWGSCLEPRVGIVGINDPCGSFWLAISYDSMKSYGRVHPIPSIK